MKWDGAGWRLPALDRAGTPLTGFPGHSAAFFAPRKLMLLLAVSKSLKLSFSSDKVNFTQVPAPLVAYDTDEWNRPAPDALYAYPSLVGENGTNTIGERGWLTYAYVPPNEDFTQRYLIVHEIALTPHAGAQTPQVRTPLARHKAADGRLWATVAPAIEKGPRIRGRENARRSHDRGAARAFREARGMRAHERGCAGLSSGQRQLRCRLQAAAQCRLCPSRCQPGTAALYACAAPARTIPFRVAGGELRGPRREREAAGVCVEIAVIPPHNEEREARLEAWRSLYDPFVKQLSFKTLSKRRRFAK